MGSSVLPSYWFPEEIHRTIIGRPRLVGIEAGQVSGPQTGSPFATNGINGILRKTNLPGESAR